MSQKIIKANQPCLVCDSSDARQIYEDGSSHCFSCNTPFPAKGKSKVNQIKIKKTVRTYGLPTLAEIQAFKSCQFTDRKISKEVNEFFGVKAAFDEDGEIIMHYYPYGENTYKIREVDTKKFYLIGDTHTKALFGMDKFSSGGNKIIITEGEIDALTYAEVSLRVYEKIYPVVSIRSSTSLSSLVKHREWLRSFKEVIISFDEDEAGQVAVEKAIRIIGLDKILITKLPFKDINQVFLEKGLDTVRDCLFSAGPFIPSGILKSKDIWNAIEKADETPSIPYPVCFEGFNKKLLGMRMNEIALFIAGTGCLQKSTLIRKWKGEEIPVEDIVVGDLLVNDTLEPTKVLELKRGREMMVHVKIKGRPDFYCNLSHILSVVDTNGRIFDISVRKYLRHWRKNELKAFNVNNQKYNMEVYIAKMDDFYGFELDGNGRFCLASGIVTHNSGKSTVFKEILLHLLEVTDSKIGVISLEESPAETGRILTGMSINTNFAFNPIHRDKYKDDFNKIFESEKIILLDHGGSAPSELSLLDKIEYMCLIGCRYILFDHITLFAAESSDGSNDNAIMDSIMAHLAGIVKKYPVWIGLISHLRKVVSGSKAFESGVLPSIDDIKGSGSLKQICYDIIAFTRDMTADDEIERNNVIAAILKCRFTGLTGKVPGFRYEYQTGRLKAIENTEFIEV